MSCVLAVSA